MQAIAPQHAPYDGHCMPNIDCKLNMGLRPWFVASGLTPKPMVMPGVKPANAQGCYLRVLKTSTAGLIVCMHSRASIVDPCLLWLGQRPLNCSGGKRGGARGGEKQCNTECVRDFTRQTLGWTWAFLEDWWSSDTGRYDCFLGRWACCLERLVLLFRLEQCWLPGSSSSSSSQCSSRGLHSRAALCA